MVATAGCHLLLIATAFHVFAVIPAMECFVTWTQAPSQCLRIHSISRLWFHDGFEWLEEEEGKRLPPRPRIMLPFTQDYPPLGNFCCFSDKCDSLPICGTEKSDEILPSQRNDEIIGNHCTTA
jgi:hypothetical protein